MRKGEATRQAILERASALATRVGLQGLSIGGLAEDLDLSKSGLFAHFKSKETLQQQVVEYAAERFVTQVIRPALSAPRGEPRLRALFQGWLTWVQGGGEEDGCFFVSATAELDDRPCAARDVLVRQQKDWRDVMANVVRTGIDEGHFGKLCDPAQFAFELHGVMLAFHTSARLLCDPRAEHQVRTAFDSLVQRARAAR
jgi:AcrR family transcriptional regulator